MWSIFKGDDKKTSGKTVVSDKQYEGAKKWFDNDFTEKEIEDGKTGFKEITVMPTDLKDLNKAITHYKKALTNSIKMIKFYANDDQMGKSQEWERKQTKFGNTQQELHISKIELTITDLEESGNSRAKTIMGYITSCEGRIKLEQDKIDEYRKDAQTEYDEMTREIKFLKVEKAEIKGIL
jgi:hypothetical protein